MTQQITIDQKDKVVNRELSKLYVPESKAVIENWNKIADYQNSINLVQKNFLLARNFLIKKPCRNWLIVQHDPFLHGADTSLFTVLLPLLTKLPLNKIAIASIFLSQKDPEGQTIIKGTDYEVRIFDTPSLAQKWFMD